MFLTIRESLGDSNKALNIVFYVLAAVLFILLCTVAVLHCILRRQLRQYVQSSPHSMVILHITASGSPSPSDSESYVQEKTNDDNAVPSIQVSYTSFPNESGCPFRISHISPSSLEKASDNDISNRPPIVRPVPSYTPAPQ